MRRNRFLELLLREKSEGRRLGSEKGRAENGGMNREGIIKQKVREY